MSPQPLSRRHFLLASAAVPVGVGIGVRSASAQTAQTSAAATSGASVVSVDQADAFTAAAASSGVPVSVLAAFSYAQTQWGDHADRPSTSGGFGPMHLIDGAAVLALARERSGKDVEGLDTLGQAASLTGLSKDTLRSDPAANIAGAAAVIAANQKAAGAPTNASDAGSWYAAVAASSGLVTADAQLDFADQVMGAATQGASRTLADGTMLRTSAAAGGNPSPQRNILLGRCGQSKKLKAAPYPLDAPKGLDVAWVPAPYEQLSADPGDYGNYDLKPNEATPKLRYVVIHDTECSFDVALKLVQDPTYLGWHYTVRSGDGHIAEHMRAAEAVGWHAGNWYINSHSIGVEHEGYMAHGSSWYSEPLYRASAALVKFLCLEHRIPIDRAHIIGHDMVPGVTTANIKGMHVDPGPYWDWEHYFELLGAPLDKGVKFGPRKQGLIEQVVRILPRFSTNTPPITGCDTAGAACPVLPANFVYVYSQPSTSAPLVKDLGLYPAGTPCTYDASDMGARATAGQEYVTIERRGDWLSIWYLGQQGWILDPDKTPRTAIVKNARVATAKPGVTAKIYGRAYPEASAYPADTAAQAISPLPYTFSGPQKYVVTDEEVVADYYKAKTYSLSTPGDHVDIVGKTRYVQLSFGARIEYAMAADVTIRNA